MKSIYEGYALADIIALFVIIWFLSIVAKILLALAVLLVFEGIGRELFDGRDKYIFSGSFRKRMLHLAGILIRSYPEDYLGITDLKKTKLFWMRPICNFAGISLTRVIEFIVGLVIIPISMLIEHIKATKNPANATLPERFEINN